MPEEEEEADNRCETKLLDVVGKAITAYGSQRNNSPFLILALLPRKHKNKADSAAGEEGSGRGTEEQ